MKFDPVKQFAKLREQLLSEKSQLEARLQELYAVLGTEPTALRSSPSAPTVPEKSALPKTGRARRPGRAANALSMREAVLKALGNGPLGRQELVKAVENQGYVFTTKNPLNSIGAILYAKNSPVKKKAGKFFVAGGASSATAHQGNGHAPAKKKRTMSAEAKAKISAAQKARWAKRKRA